ncbi:MAG: hypothetical protein J0G94_12855 [Sphingomonadales bacterium]|nr:hypothetical protein [Sphingomonadales bacterium]
MGETAAAERAHLIGMITGAWKTRVIGEGVKLGLFDKLTGGPLGPDQLAQATGANPDGVMRLLRALATLGLVRHEPGNRFALAPLGQYLRKDAPDSLNGMAGHWSERMWNSFTGIGASIATGEASVPSGPEHFAQHQADIGRADVFNRAMAEGSLRVGRALARIYDFSDCDSVMDVGGGYGALLVGPLEANPHLKGQVYDLPTLSEAASRFLGEQGVAGRVAYVGGSFFEGVPPGVDCLMLKFILHDWSDAKSLIILNNCRKAVEDGRILIIERIVPETVSEADEEVIRGDLTMLTVGGKERTEAEYHALLEQAGLKITKIAPIDAVYSVIEARAA